MSKRRSESLDEVLSAGRHGTPAGSYCTCLEDKPCPVHYKAEAAMRAALLRARVALLECLTTSLLTPHEGPLLSLLDSLDTVRDELPGVVDGGRFERELSRLAACATSLMLRHLWSVEGGGQ